MRRYEDECVGCPPEIGCLGSSCPYKNVARDYCDFCGEEGAIYKVDGDDYCEDCMKAYLHDIFDDLSISEQAELLNVNVLRNDD